QQSFSAASRASHDSIAVDSRITYVRLRPGEMNNRVYSPHCYGRHAWRRLGVLGMRRIEAGNEPASARLARDHASGGVGVAFRDGCCLSTSAVGASVNVTDLHPSLLVNGHVKEVEQIAANIRAAM